MATAKPKQQTMEELLSKHATNLNIPKRGDVVIGKIIDIAKKAIRVDIGAKTEGAVADKEFEAAKEFIVGLKIGDDIEVQVVSSDNDKGQIALSLKKSAVNAKWDLFQELFKKDEAVDVFGLDVNKGGLIVTAHGMRGFVPSSQFGKQYMGNLHQLKSKTFPVKIIEVDQEKNRLIFSERHVSEADQLAQREHALESVEINGVYSGVVSGVMPFGLFVTVEVPVRATTSNKTEKSEETEEVAEKAETKTAKKSVKKAKDSEVESDVKKAAPKNVEFGNVEGLVHISEISWEKVSNPKDYHSVGDTIQVKVLGVDEDTGKLNLSLKQMSDDPWKTIAEKYPVGTTFVGTVSRVESFGIFVHAEAGVDGLMHMSKIDANQEYAVADEITVTVENIDPDQRRMSLSPVLTELPVGYK